MKIIALIGCLFLCTFAMGQRGPKPLRDFKSLVLRDYNYPYDSTNCDVYYKMVKSLIEYNNPDSSYKAKKIMLGLYFYDSVKYAFELHAPLVYKIEQLNRQYYENTIKGTWRFSHDFWTGLVSTPTTTTAKDTGKVIKFNGRTASIYFNDTLIRKTAYKLVAKQRGTDYSRHTIFSIHFEDKDEDWEFILDWDKQDSKTNLIVTLDPSCSCGCGEHIYKKINDLEAPLIVTGNNANK
jgi:hypothetical protein